MGSQRRVKKVRRRLFRRVARLSLRHKSLGIFFILALVGSLRVTKVEADNFYPGADGSDCDFAYAESLTVSSLPSGEVVDYNVSQVEGVVDSGWISSHTLDSIATISYPYSQRELGVRDRVAVPPRSTVDIGMFVYNHTGHSVEVLKGYLFLSKNDGSGDFSRLGAVGYSDTDVVFTLRGHDMVKHGKVVELGNLGSYENHYYPGGLAKGKKIYSFEVEQPLRFVSQNIDYSFNSDKELLVEIEVEVENVSPYNLNNVFYKHRDFSSYENFDSGEVQHYDYEFNLGKNYSHFVDLGRISIEDPNTQTECIVDGRDWSDRGYNPDHWTLILARSDSNTPSGWTGNQGEWPTRPSGDSMCVTRIPYAFRSEDLSLDLDSDLNLESFLETDKGSNLKEADVVMNDIFEVDLSLTNRDARADSVEICTSYESDLVEILDSCGGEILDDRVVWSLDSLDYDSVWDCSLVYKVKIFSSELSGEYELISRAGEDSCLGGVEEKNYLDFSLSSDIEIDKGVNNKVVQGGDEFCLDRRVVNRGNGTLEDVILEIECNNCTGLDLVSGVYSGLDIGIPQDIPVDEFAIEECYEVGEDFIGNDTNHCLSIREEEGNILYNDCIHLIKDKQNSIGDVIYDLSIGENGILDNSLNSLKVKFNPQEFISISSNEEDKDNLDFSDDLEKLAKAGERSVFFKVLVSSLMVFVVIITLRRKGALVVWDN